MTDPHDPRAQDGDLPSGDLPSGGELTEAEEREVAALLADLAVGGPSTTPPTVVARLDAVLDDLLAERGADPVADPGTQAGTRAGTVVPLTPPTARPTAQRRRRVTRTLLAAAAVVVGGYTVGSLAMDGALTGVGDMGAGESAAGGSGSGPQAAQAERDRADGTDSKALREGQSMSVVPTVREDHLAADVRRVVRLFDGRGITDNPGDDRGDPREGTGEQGGDTAEETRECPVPRLTEDQQLYEVRFRGDRAGLVVEPDRQERVQVTIYSCRTGGVQLTRTVPAP